MGTGILNTIRPKVSPDTKRDYLLLSCLQTSTVIRKLLDDDQTIICDLSDRNGPVHEFITSINGNVINTVNGNVFTMTDNFLYDITYDKPHDNFRLYEHDEYFEKITV